MKVTRPELHDRLMWCRFEPCASIRARSSLFKLFCGREAASCFRGPDAAGETPRFTSSGACADGSLVGATQSRLCSPRAGGCRTEVFGI